MQFAVGQLTLGLLDRLHQVIGQGTIIGAAYLRVGRRLCIATAGDQHLLNICMDDILLPLTPTGSFAQLPTKCSPHLTAGLCGNEIPRTGEVPLSSGSVERVHHARDGAGMAAVHDDGEVYTRSKFSKGLSQPVVTEGILPVQIGGTQNFIPMIGFIAIVIRHV